MSAKSVLLTGATGFIGRHVAACLATDKCEVVSLQRSSENVSGVSETLALADFKLGNLMTALNGRKFDWLIHLAGYGVRPWDRDAETMFSVNADMARRIIGLGSLLQVKACFVAGSGSEYDLSHSSQPVREDHPLETSKLYGASKAAGSISALATATNLKLPLAIGRIFGTYGPGEASHRLLPSLIVGLQRGIRIPLTSGNQLRDNLYVEDVVSAIFSLLKFVEEHPSQVLVNIATGAPETVRHFAQLVAEEVGAPKAMLGFGDLEMRPDETMCFSGSPERLMTLTGWHPKFDLRDGIHKSVGLLRTH